MNSRFMSNLDSFKENIGAYFGFTSENNEKYVNKLLDDKSSPFSSREKGDAPIAEIFVLSVILGFRKGYMPDTRGEKRKQRLRMEYLKEKDLSILITIYLKYYDFDFKKLMEFDDFYEKTQSYADGGIKDLHDLIFDNEDDFDRNVNIEFKDEIKKFLDEE